MNFSLLKHFFSIEKSKEKSQMKLLNFNLKKLKNTANVGEYLYYVKNNENYSKKLLTISS